MRRLDLVYSHQIIRGKILAYCICVVPTSETLLLPPAFRDRVYPNKSSTIASVTSWLGHVNAYERNRRPEYGIIKTFALSSNRPIDVYPVSHTRYWKTRHITISTHMLMMRPPTPLRIPGLIAPRSRSVRPSKARENKLGSPRITSKHVHRGYVQGISFGCVLDFIGHFFHVHPCSNTYDENSTTRNESRTSRVPFPGYAV